MTPARHRLVLTGGPASGKTELFTCLKTLPQLSEFVFLDELARQLLESNPSYRKDWHQFHLEIYRRQTAREEQLGDRNFVTDRGTVDAFAFHPETLPAVGTTIEDEYRRYSAVIQLGSSASLGEQYYVTDVIRTETIFDALAVEAAIKKVWQDHPGYHFIKAEPEIKNKRMKVAELLQTLLGVSQLDIE